MPQTAHKNHIILYIMPHSVVALFTNIADVITDPNAIKTSKSQKKTLFISPTPEISNITGIHLPIIGKNVITDDKINIPITLQIFSLNGIVLVFTLFICFVLFKFNLPPLQNHTTLAACFSIFCIISK